MSTVLIAEDSATQRALLESSLAGAGYRVRVARHGAEAWRLALEERPDIVVTDIMMPEVDGYQLCRDLKAHPELRRVPVVLLTALSNPADIIAGLECGADGFIGKPFRVDYLLSQLGEILETHALPVRETADGAVLVKTAGRSYEVRASRVQTLDLLLSVYNAALRRNRELLHAERELIKLNRELERKFKDREQLLERERAAREEAEHATRMKEEFLATVSHELRTPLGAISAWVQVLRESEPDSQELQDALEVIERNAWAQTRIVDDLLDTSRIVSGKLRLSFAPLDLVQVVRAGIDTVQPAAAAADVRLVAEIEPTAAPLSGDGARLQQVVWNLVNNAVKFTPAGGRVTVHLHATGDSYTLRVQDTGIGIAPTFLPFVFDRFRQSDSSTRRKHGGLGLGLAIAKSIVDRHGGNVAAASDGPGRGATFSVRLPKQPALIATGEEPTPADRPHAAAGAAAPAATRLDGLRLLLVEDQPDARHLLERLLRDRGGEVTATDNARQAFSILQSQPVDVLVSDIGLEEEDGHSLIARIRASTTGGFASVPALALTAFARAEDEALALAAGFDDYLTKPVEIATLVARVARLGAGDRGPRPDLA